MPQQGAAAVAREREERARAELAARAAIQVPTCPEWCDLRELGEGHEYQDTVWDVAPFTFVRTHLRRIGLLEVGVTEQNAEGVVSFWEPYCDLGPVHEVLGDVGEGLFNANQLRALMADMATAAALLDEINGAQA